MSSRRLTIFIQSFNKRRFEGLSPSSLQEKELSHYLRFGMCTLAWGRVGFIFAGDVLVRVFVLSKEQTPGALRPQAASPIASNDARVIAQSLMEQTYDGPCQISVTSFQLRVLQAACTVPRGHCATYGDIARRIKSPQGARAVGAALSTNPLALLVPCHRIVGARGLTGGYRWGATIKKTLLSEEGAA